MQKDNADDDLIKKLYRALNLFVYYMQRGFGQEKDETGWYEV